MKRSLLSAAAGLLAGGFSLMIAFAPSEIGPRVSEWPWYFIIGVLYGAPLVLIVWLLILWPLYVHVSMDSVLWKPMVCISAGALSGAVLYFTLLRLIFQFPIEVLLSLRHMLTGMIVGIVTTAVGCYLKRHDLPHKVA